MFIGKFAGFLISKFYQNPTQKSYEEIMKYDKVLNDDAPYKIFKLKVRVTWNIEPTLTNNELEILKQKEEYLLNPDHKLDGCDLDTLWSLFYATGDKVYPDRVYAVSQDSSQYFAVVSAAKCSYKSHKENGALN